MDLQRVPDTLPHSTSVITQTCPVSPAGERHPEVAPASQDSGSTQNVLARVPVYQLGPALFYVPFRSRTGSID